MSNDDHLHIPADAAFSRRIPELDDRERLVCDACEYVIYENPKIVVGVVATWQQKVLLVKREIEPRRGYWALPAGYMELNETADEGAAREAWEEARAKLKIDQLLAIYSIPQISQVQIIYRAKLSNPEVSAGPESQAVALFDRDDVPWRDLAFPTVEWALNQHYSVQRKSSFPPFSNPLDA